MTSSDWASLIALAGALVLAGSAINARRIGARKVVTFGLAWVAIFALAALVFATAGR